MDHFHEPVRIVLGTPARLMELRTAIEAVDTLENWWPPLRGKWYFAAREACRAAGEGKASVHIARRMFLYAATESHIALVAD